jgi:RNA polymerase sigma factor (sigma-70 family)
MSLMGDTIQPMRRNATETAFPGAASVEDLLAAFFDAHYVRMVRLAGLVCRGGVLAEDAVQAAMEQAWRRRSSLRDPGRLRWWLDRIVVREAIRMSRRPWWSRLSATQTDEQASLLPDPAGDAASQRLALSAAFATLSPEQRAACVLHLHLGYGVAKTAELMGVGVAITTASGAPTPAGGSVGGRVMTTVNDDLIRAFLADEARRAVAAAPSLEQAVGRLGPRIGGRRSGGSRRLIVLLAATLLLAAALGTAIAVGSGILRLPSVTHDPVDLGIFEPVAGWIVYGSGGIWGVDPSAPEDRVQLTSKAGTPLAWSSDGTRLLVTRGSPRDEHLFVLHADRSETQVTDRPMSIGDATFSADGSRVVFAAAESADGQWAVYSIDADGGPATVLTSQIQPWPAALTFSPDGTQIAYVLWGGGDHGHSVWVVDADGTGAHEILANDTVMGAGHVRDRDGAVAWSPAGDRIALGLEGTIYTFATDGSDFAQVTGGDSPLWSPDGSQVVNRRSAIWHPGTPADDAGG